MSTVDKACPRQDILNCTRILNITIALYSSSLLFSFRYVLAKIKGTPNVNLSDPKQTSQGSLVQILALL